MWIFLTVERRQLLFSYILGELPPGIEELVGLPAFQALPGTG